MNSFTPMPQPILEAPQLHLNPQFIGHPPQPIFQNNDFAMDYVPTPAVRLSPRSAEYVDTYFCSFYEMY
jgi:hypothetical protein